MPDLLAEGARPAGGLVAAFPALTQPAISRHPRVLRDVGLVAVRPEGQRRVYTLRPERLAELDAWLAPCRRFWAAHLDALSAHLDALSAHLDALSAHLAGYTTDPTTAQAKGARSRGRRQPARH